MQIDLIVRVGGDEVWDKAEASLLEAVKAVKT